MKKSNYREKREMWCQNLEQGISCLRKIRTISGWKTSKI